MALLWHQLQDFPYLMAQLDVTTPERLGLRLEDRRTVLLELAEGQILLAALHIVPRLDADVYLAAWDHHLSGREDEIRDGLRYLFRLGQLRRVTLRVPDAMVVLVKLAKRLGFTWEGVLRHGWADGDLYVHGLLREELDGHRAAAA